MNVISLALRNIRGSTFRSAVVFLCVMGVAGFLVATTLIIKGAENSLNVGIERPEGAETRVETALLMGKPTKVWMSEVKMDEVTLRLLAS